MIDCVDLATAHLFGDAIATQHRLRYRVFVERRGWSVSTWQGMEFDEFDTPATTYFIWRDQSGEARGVSRVTPTELPYMLETLWPSLVQAEPLPKDPRVWEGSRIGIDRGLTPRERHRIVGELFCAYLEFGLLHGIDRYLVMMPVAYLKGTLDRCGWPTQVLGPSQRFDSLECAAASLKVSYRTLEAVRASMKIEGPVLRTGYDLVHDKAA